MHWDESSGLPPIVQVSSKVFPGRPTNALIICVNTTIVRGCGLVPENLHKIVLIWNFRINRPATIA